MRNRSLDGLENREVADMEEPARRILGAMERKHGRITSGHYRLVVGDDASGRLFGHIFANVIGRVHALLGYPPPGLAFLVGHPKRESSFYTMMTKVASERLSHILGTNLYSDLRRTLPRPLEPGMEHPQVLVTTDGIQSGTSLIPIVKSCKHHEIGLDAAAIRVFGGYADQHQNLNGVGVYDGEGDRSIYQVYKLIGVEKTLGVDTISRSLSEIDGYTESIASARRDVAVVSDRLAEWCVEEFHLGKTRQKRARCGEIS